MKWLKYGTRALLAASLPVLLCACSILGFGGSRQYINYPVRRGDTVSAVSQRFDVPVDEILRENRISDPRTLQVGQILKVPYRGQSLARDSADKSSSDLRASLKFSARGEAPKKIGIARADRYVGKLVWPVGSGGGSLSSSFGWRWFSFHEGLDISAKEGTRIYAAHDGQVVYSGHGINGYGNLIVIKGDGLLSVYGHNKVNRVSRGDHVRKSELIGEVGMSGKASGPHLHFETRIQDESGKYAAVDPLVFYRRR